MAGLDIIGDIHGHADALVALLRHLGYREDDGVWYHPDRQAIFVGDFIDRGPSQRRVLGIVSAMCAAGTAEAIMGNHEYNAVCYATPDPNAPHQYLRARTQKNRRQHAAFLDEVVADSREYHHWIGWFRRLPLWLERDGLRIIHACWHDRHRATLTPWLDEQNRLTREGFVMTARRQRPEHEALETLLKGHEIALPDGQFFLDKDGSARREIRTRWWLNEPSSYREVALVAPTIAAQLPDTQLSRNELVGYHDDVPVFIGHYWLEGEPTPLAEHVACTDYSIANGGKLCAYRWDGERVIRRDRFAWVEMPYDQLYSPTDATQP